MAFVIPTAEINFKTSDIPGPGNYNITKVKPTAISYAPFNSTTLRKKNKKKQQILPGPGQYKEVELKKVYQFETPGNHMFLSKVERFKQTQQTNVGPTYYSTESKIELKGKQTPKKQTQMINYIRQHNHARKTISIKRPTNYIRIIYNNPNSTQNTLTQYVDIDFMNRNLGPGQYDINKVPQQHKRAVSWSRSKTKRFQENQKKYLGPGQYNLEQQHPKKNIKNNAVFAYQGVRTHFQSLLYKTNLHDVAHLRQYIKYKDPQPGPGFYQAEKIQQKPIHLFQFFGSTSQRFLKYNKKDNQSNFNIGPGSYYVDSNLNKKISEAQERKRKKLNKLRATTVVQNQRKSLQNQIPGPATYDDKSKTLKQTLFNKFKVGHNGQFGIRQKRFKTQTSNKAQIPGPGQYNLQQSPKMRDSVYSTYISQSKRVQQRKLDTPFGKYQIDCNDINKQLQKKKQFIQNLKKIAVNKPPFQTTEKRFKTLPNQIKNSQKIVENLNLQAQNVDERQVLRINEQKLKVNVKFNSTQKRFVQKIQDFPPPGHYHKNNPVQKYSYNIKYGYKKL